MQQILTVIEVSGSDAIVLGERASSCHSCAGKTSCSTLGSWNQRTVHIRIENRLHAKVGDRVVVEVPDSWLIKVAFRLYGLPMFGFLGGGMLGLWLAELFQISAEASSAIGGIVGACLVYLLLWRSEEVMDATMVRIDSHAACNHELISIRH
ncbi:MAG: hypothetical protein AUJ56_06725 [Zetaproteobacteria bacterium CG1_02_49_23]|nr:MAG: hypothetical protein AUJ56_06725 [Zetaproteobacteria bacterium CG1_02_49_23]